MLIGQRVSHSVALTVARLKPARSFLSDATSCVAVAGFHIRMPRGREDVHHILGCELVEVFLLLFYLYPAHIAHEMRMKNSHQSSPTLLTFPRFGLSNFVTGVQLRNDGRVSQQMFMVLFPGIVFQRIGVPLIVFCRETLYCFTSLKKTLNLVSGTDIEVKGQHILFYVCCREEKGIF